MAPMMLTVLNGAHLHWENHVLFFGFSSGEGGGGREGRGKEENNKQKHHIRISSSPKAKRPKPCPSLQVSAQGVGEPTEVEALPLAEGLSHIIPKRAPNGP